MNVAKGMTKKYTRLWDAYVFADFVTYPSWWEGWGNQLLEAVRAKLPVALFEYPVIWPTSRTGFRVISFGDQIHGRDVSGFHSSFT